jgi:hypothetical protein
MCHLRAVACMRAVPSVSSPRALREPHDMSMPRSAHCCPPRAGVGAATRPRAEYSVAILFYKRARAEGLLPYARHNKRGDMQRNFRAATHTAHRACLCNMISKCGSLCMPKVTRRVPLRTGACRQQTTSRTTRVLRGRVSLPTDRQST